MSSITDNTLAKRFELVEEGHTAYADYRKDGAVLTINYVFSPPELRGKGTAGRLMEGIVLAAKLESLEIYPVCAYAASWLKRQNH